MKAVILAAGRGSRLNELTANTPKPMLMLRDGIPLLEMIVCGIRDAGVHEFVIITGYRGDQIQGWFGDGARFGIQIQYIEQKVINGTGGALCSARAAVGDSLFLMSFGDILVSTHNYKRLVDEFYNRPASALMMVNQVDDPCAGSAIYFDQTTFAVQRIIEKPPKGSSTSNWNQAGISLFDPEIFTYLERIPLSPRGEYEIVDALQMMIQDQRTVRAVPVEGFWSDIGTPEDVQSVREMFKNNADFLSSSFTN